LGELTILHYEGAKTILWDPDEDHQIKSVEDYFNSLMKRGFSALIVDPDKEEGYPTDRFDSKAKKILMFPMLSGG
jgi:hypothetical protein